MHSLLCHVDQLYCGIVLTQLSSRKRVLQQIFSTIFKFLISNTSQPEQFIRFYEGLTPGMSALETLTIL